MNEAESRYLTEIQEKQIDIIDYYGIDHQLLKLAEECAELIQAILKDDDIFKANIIAEMADVFNLIEQIRLKDDFIDKGIDSIKEYKVNREIDRIRNWTIDAWKLAVD